MDEKGQFKAAPITSKCQEIIEKMKKEKPAKGEFWDRHTVKENQQKRED